MTSNVVVNPVEAFKELGEHYSEAQAVYVGWKTDVNLRPPVGLKNKIIDDDPHVVTYYNSLQYSLFETGRPETVDRTATPRADHTIERIVIAVLSSPVECMSILLEGGRQFPDGFHLILSPTWISKVPSQNSPGLYTLLIHKAITFHREGYSYIDEFLIPRHVTYLLNYFTYNITGGQRSDGNEIEKNLDCPMSSSVQLAALVDDKVWTRLIMAEVGLDYPETLALFFKPKRPTQSCYEKIKIVSMNDKENTDVIVEAVYSFLNMPFMKEVEKIVVKPSWPNAYGSIGVTIHDARNFNSVIEAALGLWKLTEEGSSVLVESFIDTIIPDKDMNSKIQWLAEEQYGFRARVTVCRDFDNVPVTTMINCGMGFKSAPINGDNSVGQTLDTTLQAYNVTNPIIRGNLDDEIRLKGQAVMKGIIRKEQQLTEAERGARYGQTDVIGIDMIITKRGDRIFPVGVEVNSHDCTINCQIMEFVMECLNYTGVTTSVAANDPNLYIERKDSMLARGNISRRLARGASGRSVRPFVRTMIQRSQKHVMRGKIVVVIGAGGYSKRFIWPEAKKQGVKLVLVESDPNHFAKEDVFKFIFYDFTDHTLDYYHATNIIESLRNADIQLDGCLTFWEDCVPLAALISQRLKLNGGSDYQASLNAKQKSRTQNILNSRRDDIPHWPRTYLYSVPALTIRCKEDVDGVAEKANFPCILKLEHGSSAVGVILVHNEDQLREEYGNVVSSLQKEEDFPGIGLGHSNNMLVVDYHQGSEHDVDVVIFNRKLVAAFVSDNGPTRVPLFTETAAIMPSVLPTDKQAQLITAAYQCCTEIGLANGTFNVELKMTPSGPKLIEINARMGGFYLRDWIKEVYGVDIMFYSLMVASGVKPHVPKLLPVKYMLGIMLIPSLHRHILEDEETWEEVKTMHDNGDIYFSRFSEHIEIHPLGYEEPFGNIAVMANNVQAAKEKLKAVCAKFNIDQTDYDVKEFIKHF